MSSEGSDIEMQSTLPKKITKKMPKSPSEEMLMQNQEAKRVTTKEMINQALSDLKSRKGTSLYAIKKYIEDKYRVDVEKLNYIIKKSIKTGVETGTIVQTKGVGASGSFKLPPKNPEKKDKPKKNIEKPSKSQKSVKPKKKKETKLNEKSNDLKNKQNLEKSKTSKSKEKKEKSKKETELPPSNETKPKKSKATKIAKGLQTPAKKKSAMMKRKSIGSIIKPPKMNPKKG